MGRQRGDCDSPRELRSKRRPTVGEDPRERSLAAREAMRERVKRLAAERSGQNTNEHTTGNPEQQE